MVAHLLLGQKVKVFGCDNNFKLANKNTNFRHNKIFGKQAISFTDLSNKLHDIKIHDRLIQGGNGTIWGGFINVEEISNNHLELFRDAHISLVPLSSTNTGSISPNKNIHQLHFPNETILNPANLINHITNAYLSMLEVLNDGSIRLIFYKTTRQLQNSLEIFTCDRLVLAVGVVQLIDLLYRSNYINDGDTLEMTEFKCRLRLVLKYSKIREDTQVIRVNFIRGLLHFFGIQRYFKLASFIDRFIPLSFDQIFYHVKVSRSMSIQQGSLHEIEGGLKFGSSIHYCNLKINGTEINEFLNKIHPGLIGLGMACVNQSRPGPIANDIFLDALKKLDNTGVGK